MQGRICSLPPVQHPALSFPSILWTAPLLWRLLLPSSAAHVLATPVPQIMLCCGQMGTVPSPMPSGLSGEVAGTVVPIAGMQELGRATLVVEPPFPSEIQTRIKERADHGKSIARWGQILFSSPSIGTN